MENANYEPVDHPLHYNQYSEEVIDMMKAIYGTTLTAIFCEMNAFKYRMRLGIKPNNPIDQDLKKEAWYITKRDALMKGESLKNFIKQNFD